MSTPSPRQNKIARLVQKEMAEMLQVYAKNYMSGTIISVTNTRMSPDFSLAKVYISTFPTSKSGDVLKNLNNNLKEIRFQLGQRTKNQLRKVPEIVLYLDDSLDYIENINSLLKPE